MKKAVKMLAAAGVLSLGILTGCGATTESVVEKMFETEMNSFAADSDIAVDVELSVGEGMSFDANVKGTVTMEMMSEDEENSAVHMLSDLTVKAMGEKRDVDYEAYTITEDGETTMYTYDADEDVWYFEVSELTEGLDERTMGKIRDAVKDVLLEAALEKKLEDVNGEKCYVLKLDTTLDAFSKVIEIAYKASADAIEETGVDFSLDDIEDILETIHVNLTYYVSKDNGYLARTVIDLSETDGDDLVDAINEAYGDMFGGFIDFDEVAIDISSLSFDITYSGVNDTDVSVPRDVEKNAVEKASFDWDDEYADFGDNTDLDSVDTVYVEEPAATDPDVTDYGYDNYDGSVYVDFDGSVELRSYYDDSYLMWVYPIDDNWEADTIYSSNNRIYFNYQGNEDIYITVDALLDDMTKDYIVNGVEPSAEYVDGLVDYEASMQPIDRMYWGSLDAWYLHEEYTFDDGTSSIYDSVVISYVDADGADEYIVCYFPDEVCGNWTVDDYNEAALAIFN